MSGFQGCGRALRAQRQQPTTIARPVQRAANTSGRRRGAAVVEMAVLLPLLVFLFLLAADFARVFYFSLTLTNCARAGALYASDPSIQSESPFASTQAAALADATNFSPQPTITEANGVDANGRNYVEVTAAHTFGTITGFPGIPSSLNLKRTVRLYVAVNTPTNY
jgi:Flp pilus assembly protein TadG